MIEIPYVNLKIDLVKTCFFQWASLHVSNQKPSMMESTFQQKKRHAELQQNSASKKINITPPNRPPPPSGKP